MEACRECSRWEPVAPGADVGYCSFFDVLTPGDAPPCWGYGPANESPEEPKEALLV